MANTGTRERILSCAAVLFSVAAMLVYIAGLMCSHLSAFRVATNLRIVLSRHIATLPMGQIVPAAHPADASIELDRVTFRYDEGEKAKDALHAFDGVSGFCRRVSCVAGGTGAGKLRCGWNRRPTKTSCRAASIRSGINGSIFGIIRSNSMIFRNCCANLIWNSIATSSFQHCDCFGIMRR